MNTERYLEENFNGFVEELIHSNHLNDTEKGIAKQMLDLGYGSLSDKQKYVFDKAIENNTINECKRCGSTIPWNEMLEALDNGRYCNYCQHLKEKIDQE